MFQAYDWPGNVRELQNVVERAIALCDGNMLSVDETWLKHGVPQEQRRSTVGERGRGRLNTDQERKLSKLPWLNRTVELQARAAPLKKLGVPRSTPESKIRAHCINKRVFKS
ncbi:MAG TPA: hypothetical protein VGM27_14655 [Acidobacteriaceae bacterium]